MLQEIPEIKKQGTLFDTCFINAVLLEKKVALWRLPHETLKHVSVDLGKDHLPVPFSFEENAPGFVLSPFAPLPGNKVYKIKADIYFNSGYSSDNVANELKKWTEITRELKPKNTFQLPDNLPI